MKKIYFLLCIILCSPFFGAQAAPSTDESGNEKKTASTAGNKNNAPINSYTWVGTSGSFWTDPTNWFPSRDFPAAEDSLFFEDGNFSTIIDVPDETVGYIRVINGTNITLQAASGSTALNFGTTGSVVLEVENGSSFNISGANDYAFNLVSGATAALYGDIMFSGAGHRLTAADASGVTFYSGATFIAGAGFTGNPFGSGTPNSIIFESGSFYHQLDGGDPFALAAPNSVVVFQPGSMFRMLADLPISIDGRTYGDMEIDAPGFTQSSAGIDALSIGNLAVYQGDWSIDLTAGNVSITGNIYVAPGASLSFVPATSNTLVLNGTAAQSITIDGSFNFGVNESLTIDNAAGVTLNSDITLGPGTTLNLNSGILKIDAPATMLTLSAGTTLVGGNSNASYIDGKVKKRGNTDFVFPVGKTGYGYVPIVISTFVGGTLSDEFTAEYIRGDAATLGPITAGPGLNHVSACDYWTLDRGTATPVSVDVTGYWSPSNTCGGTYINNLSSLTIAHFNGTGWNSYAIAPVLAGGSTTTAGAITWTSVTAFSPFSLASTTFGQNPLPVTINYLTGTKQNGNHLLNWKVTCNSSPSVSMEIERSTDSRNFTGIYTINATALQCQQPFNYTDAYPVTGVNHYRLKMTDAHGKVTYSSMVTLINADKGFDITGIAPNPVVNSSFELKLSTAQKIQMDIVITDMQGRLMQKQTINTIPGFNTIPVHVAKLAAGTYQVFGNTAEGRSKVLRFVIQ
jgi:hypothetical protein